MSIPGVIAVIGASGGVGASSLVVGLALRAARAGRRVACVDGRAHSGGLDVVAGADQARGLRWADLAGVRGAVPGDQLCGELPAAGPVPVVSYGGPPVISVAAPVLCAVTEAIADAVDLCVVDLPHLDSPGHAALRALAGDVLLVCGAGVPALAAASVVGAELTAASDQPVWLCQRASRRVGDLGEVVAQGLRLPLAAVVPDDPSVEADLMRGVPPGTSPGGFAKACDTALAVLDAARRGAVA